MDRRITKSKKAIYTAFLELLNQKGYDNLTVQEISDLADVGRSTFYAHFDSKEILLELLCREFIFGILFNSSAILADAVHDLGDALAIGLSVVTEYLSDKEADKRFSLGYKRFSLLGAMITSAILISGSAFILVENMPKLFKPEVVNKEGMFWMGVIAITINLIASRVVSHGHTKNESILSLHFLEDTLGWLAVIIVSIVLRFTDWYFLDPLLSLLIAVFILTKAVPKFWENTKIFLNAVPEHIDLKHLEEELEHLQGHERHPPKWLKN